MSSTTISHHELPATIRQRLKKLRWMLGGFLLVDGLSRLLAVALAVVLVDVFLDRVFEMDFAQRLIMLVVMAGVLLAVLYWRLVRPFSRKVSDDALILQVEEKHRGLRQSVISAAQFARGGHFESEGYSRSMVDATIQHGTRQAEQVDFGTTIDRAALARNLVLLVFSAAGLLAIAYGATNHAFWNTWFQRNILLTDDQWPRDTRLIIEGVEDGTITLVRGEDHRQVVRVDPNSRVTSVKVSIESDDGFTRTREDASQTDKLEHTLVFRNVNSEFRFRATGGDDTTEWVEVRLVEAPHWTSQTLTMRAPEYTGLGSIELPAGGGTHSILAGSTLFVQGEPNKPLKSAALKNADQVWQMNYDPATGKWQCAIPPKQLTGGKYTFDLVDESGMRSGRPTSFLLKVKPDRPPSLRATLTGISRLVVPRARIPVEFTATDEFSITQLQAETSWTGDESESVPQTNVWELTQLNAALVDQIGQSEIDSRVVIELEPIGVPTEVSLRLTLSAKDNNTRTGPGIGASRGFIFRVVTEDELRADLLRREIEQRKAFELIVENQESLIFDLQGISDRARDAQELAADRVSDQLRDAQRRQKRVGTNASTIADRFQGFLQEAINNRLDEAESEIDQGRSIEERFNLEIIQPIRTLDDPEIVRAAQLIELCLRSVAMDPESGQPTIDRPALQSALTNTIDKQNQILESMKEILAAMKDSETYQEIVNKVIEIKRTEEQIRDRARKKREDIRADDIFDDDSSDGLFDDEEKSGDKGPENKKEDG